MILQSSEGGKTQTAQIASVRAFPWMNSFVFYLHGEKEKKNNIFKFKSHQKCRSTAKYQKIIYIKNRSKYTDTLKHMCAYITYKNNIKTINAQYNDYSKQAIEPINVVV